MAQESGHSLVESYASGSFKTAIRALVRSVVSSEGSTGGSYLPNSGGCQQDPGPSGLSG